MSDDHQPVLCEETINLICLDDSSAAVYVDATFGRGGHTRALLARLDADARVIGIDQDEEALAAGASLARQEPRLTLCHARFSELAEVLMGQGVGEVSGVIMDLGVSSPQLDDAGRGFSFRGDGPIDMRMDRSRGESAGEWLNRAGEADIVRIIRTFGEERFAGRIARAIVAARPLTTTRQLADIVRQAMPRRSGSRAGVSRSDDATRTFQAIRIHTNQELDEAAAGITAAFESLCVGGRVAVISFHSLEDRLVKKTFRGLARGAVLPRGLPVRAADAPAAGRIVGKPIRASDREINANPRSRSATLRVLERLT